MQNLEEIFRAPKTEEVVEQVVEDTKVEDTIEEVEYSEDDYKPYLLNVDGSKIFFNKPMTRNFRLQMISSLSGMEEMAEKKDIEKILTSTEEVVKKILIYNYPELEGKTQEIFNYNEEEYGLNVLLEIYNIIINSVFTNAGAKNIPTFVLAHRNKKN